MNLFCQRNKMMCQIAKTLLKPFVRELKYVINVKCDIAEISKLIEWIILSL